MDLDPGYMVDEMDSMALDFCYFSKEIAQGGPCTLWTLLEAKRLVSYRGNTREILGSLKKRKSKACIRDN
jgi:hypothetical protein